MYKQTCQKVEQHARKKKTCSDFGKTTAFKKLSSVLSDNKNNERYVYCMEDPSVVDINLALSDEICDI